MITMIIRSLEILCQMPSHTRNTNESEINHSRMQTKNEAGLPRDGSSQDISLILQHFISLII